MTHSILLSGVGGQGIILAAKIIGEAAAVSGFEVCSNEIHGMAQRGGCVTAQVRFGPQVHSPIILEGTADALGALEQMEALRWAHFLKPGGLAAVSRQTILPVTVSAGKATYPADVEARLARVFSNLLAFDCASQAAAMGDARLANTILVGMVATALPLTTPAWHEAIRLRVPDKLLARNIEAFEFGRALKEESR